MYERHFGMTAKAFDIAPDPRFLFLNSNYRELLASLIYGVTHRKGLIALVGEVGTGKTMMLNSMKARLEPSVAVATIVNPDLTFRQMLNMMLADLKLDREGRMVSTDTALSRLRRFAQQQLAAGGNVLIVVDEAQNLRQKTMESLRMMLNLGTSHTHLIQIVLCGQPELDRKLKKPEWRQLVQRICIKRRSAELSAAECRDYIHHRLSVAGCDEAGLFSEAALAQIYRYSEGIPRKINILCDNALLIGYGMGKRTIDSSMVDEAVRDLDWRIGTSESAPAVKEAGALNPGGKKTVRLWSAFSARLTSVPPLAIAFVGLVLLMSVTIWGWEMMNEHGWTGSVH